MAVMQLAEARFVSPPSRSKNLLTGRPEDQTSKDAALVKGVFRLGYCEE